MAWGRGLPPVDSLTPPPDSAPDGLACGRGSDTLRAGQPPIPRSWQQVKSPRKMKNNLSAAISHRYVVALRKYLKQGPRAGLQAAGELGRQAVAGRLETLDVARIHEGALAALKASGSGDGILKRAERFFNEAITPIEETHAAALKTTARLNQLNKTLGRRTGKLTTSHRSLKQGITRRKTVEKALKQSGEYSKKLLRESRRLQEQLRQLTHQILAAQEDKRKKISRELQDEIAQTLLGINVRLLTLKEETRLGAKGLEKEIASTQQVVEKSVASIVRFAREFGKKP